VDTSSAGRYLDIKLHAPNAVRLAFPFLKARLRSYEAGAGMLLAAIIRFIIIDFVAPC